MDSFTYVPPGQLQEMKIWSPVIFGSRGEKVSAYNFSHCSPDFLFTWENLFKELLADKVNRYASVVGVVSKELIIVDVDHTEVLPENCKALLEKYPTHHHLSKSGNGWKIYYFTDTPLAKKIINFSFGQLFCGAFVSTTDPQLSNFSEYDVSKINIKQLAEFIPEADKSLKPLGIQERQATSEVFLDLDKTINEAFRILSIIPTDLDTMLKIAYETKLKNADINSYLHWLLVSHALADLAIQLSNMHPEAIEKIQFLFHKWSEKGAAYKSELDCNERFERSIRETRDATEPIVSFNTLRRLFWAYKIPVSDFPVVSIKKDGSKTVDATDPSNFEFITKTLGIAIYQEISHNSHYIRGPKSIIESYFLDEQPYFLTQNVPDISIPFSGKPKSDENLIFRLVKLFRHFGVKGCMRNNPVFAGLNKIGVQPLDTLFEWIVGKPWDGRKRVSGLLEKSITLDEVMIPNGIEPGDVYNLILKHLIHMIGLRAKGNRVLKNTQIPADRFKKAQGILILAGYQNTHKSTWIECLLPAKVGFVSSITPSSAKSTLEIQRALAGTFILNIDEIDALFDLVELSDLKNVVTQEYDSFRTMYTETFKAHPRAAGLFGTTNRQQLRLDKTGNRRFWIIPIKQCDAAPFAACDYQQVWAELLTYAEQMTIDEWNITMKEKDTINTLASQYAKSTVGGKMLDVAFTDDEGQCLLYDYREFDFNKLFSNMPQSVQRTLVKHNCLFPVRGNKCFLHLQAKFIMDSNVDFKLSSFNYEINDYLDSLFNMPNETKVYPSVIYKAGVLSYKTGKLNPTQYHFLPYRGEIKRLIEDGVLDSNLLVHKKLKL
jgi:hypothetical protein